MIRTIQIASACALFVSCGLPCFASSPQSRVDSFLGEISKTHQSAPERAALLDIQNDAATCSSFYNIAITDEKRSGENPAQIARHQAAYHVASTLTSVLGKKTGMTNIALKAQQQMSSQKLRGFSRDPLANLPVVVVRKYEPVCNQIIKNPKARFAYWVAIERRR